MNPHPFFYWRVLIQGFFILWLSPLVTGCVYNLSLFPEISPLQEKKLQGSGRDKIVILSLSGVISGAKEKGMMDSPDMISRVKEELDLAADDPSVKGVILRINSPGGTVTASDLIYHEIKKFKEKTGKVVIAVILDIGASGGYYIAMAADQVMAHPTSVTGSIGVMMLHLNLQGLLEKIGVGTESIKSAPHKDMGSLMKPLSSEDRAILQGVINTLYHQFLSVVKEGRKGLTPEQIRALADGRIYTAVEAKESGLIDKIGYMDDGIALTKAQAGIQDATIITYLRPHEFKTNIYSKMTSEEAVSFLGIKLGQWMEVGSTKFMYLWMP